MNQWIRKVSLQVFNEVGGTSLIGPQHSQGETQFQGETGLDLSQFRIRFNIQNADIETPNNAAIRVYNLSPDTIQKIRGEFSGVVLQAGYEKGNFGVVFQGSIKQYRVGRENGTETYLDILASDGDIPYNEGLVNVSLRAGSTPQQQTEAIAEGMGTSLGYSPLLVDKQYTTRLNPRGKVMFGMGRAALRNVTTTLDYSWSIQNGQIQILPLKGYLPGTAVEVNRFTGMVGIPEQTDEGIRVQCLLNSKLRIGGLIRLDNPSINQLMFQNPNMEAVPFNQRRGLQNITKLSKDGVYRLYVIEHEGDTRGNPWHSNLIGLAVDLSSGEVQG